MKITSALFAKSYYSIGPGLDIQPLIRLTHITDTFIYANLFLEKEEVVGWYEKNFSFYGFEIINKKIINNFDEKNYFEIQDRNRRISARPRQRATWGKGNLRRAANCPAFFGLIREEAPRFKFF